MLRFIEEKDHHLKGSVLIVSGISVGNVGAVTCDEIIKKDAFKRIAYFNTKHIEPSIGYLPAQIEEGALGLPAELYQKGNTLILQFRSYCRFARKRDLAKEIVQQFFKHGVSEFIVVSSFPYDIRPDLEIGSVQKNIYFKSKGNVNGLKLVENKSQNLLATINLVDEQDLEGDLLKNGGLSGALHKEADNILHLFVFSEQQESLKLAKYFQNKIARLVQLKEVTH